MEDGKAMIKILYEDNHLLVVVKPINIPVQKDKSNDQDLLTILKQYIKEMYNKPGNVYLGLVHRLDRPVGGVMVFAKTSKAASRLSKQILNNQVTKRYVAVINGRPMSNEGILIDKLLKDKKNNVVKVDEKGKLSELEYRMIKYDDKINMSLVDIKLITGRSHQIRVQFSSRKTPLYGDQKYNPFSKVGQQIALFAYQLEFSHPITNKKLTFKEDFPKSKPWNYFENN